MDGEGSSSKDSLTEVSGLLDYDFNTSHSTQEHSAVEQHTQSIQGYGSVEQHPQLTQEHITVEQHPQLTQEHITVEQDAQLAQEHITVEQDAQLAQEYITVEQDAQLAQEYATEEQHIQLIGLTQLTQEHDTAEQHTQLTQLTHEHGTVEQNAQLTQEHGTIGQDAQLIKKYGTAEQHIQLTQPSQEYVTVEHHTHSTQPSQEYVTVEHHTHSTQSSQGNGTVEQHTQSIQSTQEHSTVERYTQSIQPTQEHGTVEEHAHLTPEYVLVEQQAQLTQKYGAIEQHIHLTQEYIVLEEQCDRQTRPGCCICVIILLCLIANIIILLMLFWIPGFAERSVDQGVSFQFRKAAMLDMDSEYITMHVSGQIGLSHWLAGWSHTANSLFGAIETKKTVLDVYLNETSQIGRIDLPKMVLTDSNVTEFDFISRFKIEDKRALMEFCKSAVAEKIVYWDIEGPLSLSFGWWETGANIKKSIELQGMGGLKKADMKSISFPGEHELGGIIIEAIVGIFNPSSVLSLTLGDVNFGIYLPDSTGKEIKIAVVQAIDADLQGNQTNYFKVAGRSLPLDDKDPVTMEVMSQFLTKYIHGEVTMVNIRGSTFGPEDRPSKRHKSTTPEWLRKALEDTTLTLPFPGATETNLIRSLELSDININFSNKGNPLISGNAVALLKKPREMQFDMDVTEVDIRAFLYLDKNSTKPFAVVKPERPSPAKTIPGGEGGVDKDMMRVDSELDRAPFRVIEGGQSDFDTFLGRVYYQKKSTIYIGGKVDARVTSAFGNLVIKDLDFHGKVETKGMGGMKHPPPKVTVLNLTRGNKDSLEAITDLVIYSPSDVYINLGELNMYLLFNGHVIGHSHVPELALYPGVENRLIVKAWLYGINGSTSHLVDFIGQYISSDFGRNAKNLTLTISGNHPNATQSKFLKTFVQNLYFDVKPPPFSMEPMLADVQVNILSSTAIMSMRNPFEGIMMTIARINATASHDCGEVGTMMADFEDKSQGWKNGPLELPPPICDPRCHGVVVASEKIPVVTKQLGMDIIRRALGGSLVVSVDSIVSVRIGDFSLDDLVYQQSNIVAKVRKTF